MSWSRALALAVIIFASGVCILTTHSCNKKPSITGHTLYDSLGGTALVSDPADSGKTIQKGYLAIRTIVDTAISIIRTDSPLNNYFKTLYTEMSNGDSTNYLKLSVNLTNYFAMATGATDTAFAYKGMNMADAHNPMMNPRINGKVDSASFDEFVHDIAVSCMEYQLSDQLISRIGTLLYSVEGEVVQK